MIPEGHKLLVIDSAYSLGQVRRRKLETSITSRDLGGAFTHVWSVHPFTGADRDDAGPIGAPTFEDLDCRNTFIDVPIGRFRSLRKVGVINFALAQLTMLWRLIRLVLSENVSAIRVGDPYYLGLLGLFVSRLTRRRLVIRINANYDALYRAVGQLAYPRLLRRRSLEKMIARLVLPRADLVTAPSENNLEFALHNGADPSRSVVIGYGSLIHEAHFGPPTSSGALREELGLIDEPLVAYVGRLERVKHPADVIKAVAEANRAISPAVGLMIGDGSMRSSLESLARELDVDIRFVGNKDQPWIASALRECQAICSPLTGRALVEGLLSGTPVVAYDVEWHSEIIEHGVSGVLVPFGDAATMGQELARILTDLPLASAIGASGRAAALEMMDPSRLMETERVAYAQMFARASRKSHSLR